MAAKKTEETTSSAEHRQLLEERDRLRERVDRLNQELARQREEAGDDLRVVLRRDAKVGDAQARAGSVLALVRLAPTVSLNYLVDAVRNGVAGEALEDLERSDEEE